MKAFSHTRIAVLAVVAWSALAIAIGLFVWEPDWLFHRDELRAGNEIVARVEAFRTSHGRLPESLEDIGINDTDLEVYYRKVSEEEYIIWFGKYSLGESETYNSRNKKWE